MSNFWRSVGWFVRDIFRGGRPKSKGYPTHPRDVVGFGMSYSWADCDIPLLIRTLAESGCNATDIEYMGLAGGAGGEVPHGWRVGGADALHKKYRELLKEARASRILVIVSVTNDNMHLKKWMQSGAGIKAFPAEATRAMQIVMDEGAAYVWVQPVAETQTNEGRNLEREWLLTFGAAGFRTINNHGSRPSNNGGAWTRSYHACVLSDLGNGENILLIPDCGTAIDSYTDNGNFNTGTVVNPAAAANYVQRGRAAGRGVSIYTGTGTRDVSKQIPAIKAIGKAGKL